MYNCIDVLHGSAIAHAVSPLSDALSQDTVHGIT